MTFGMRIIIFAIFAPLCGSVRAAPLPQYDVEAECRLGAAAGEAPDTDFNECMKRETRGREQARRQSLQASAKAMRHCNDIADTGDGGSYAVLAHCLELEKTANGAPER